MDRGAAVAGEAEAAGTVVNTGSGTRNLTVAVEFVGPAGRKDGTTTAYGAAPGAGAHWFVQGPAVAQPAGCGFLPSPGDPSTPTTRPVDLVG